MIFFVILCQPLGPISIYTPSPLVISFFPSSLCTSHLAMLLFFHQSERISALRSLHWLFPLLGTFFSLIFSYCSVPPITYIEFHVISVDPSNSFSIPSVRYSRAMPFIPLPAPVIFQQRSGFLLHLSVLFKSGRCHYIGIFLWVLSLHIQSG